MFKRIFAIVLILTVFQICGSFAKDAVNIYSKPRQVPIHKIIHESGKSYLLSDFKGKFIVAVFWSRDCGPCIAELKSLNTFYNKTKDSTIKLLIISDNEEWKSVIEQKRFLKRYGAPDLEFYVDEHGQVSSDLGIFTSPHTVLINTKGEEIGRIRGSADWGDEKVIKYIKNLQEKYG